MLSKNGLPTNDKAEMSALQKINYQTKINGLLQNDPPLNTLKQHNAAP